MDRLLCLIFLIICLSLCSGHRLLIDSINAPAEKRNEIHAHLKTTPLAHAGAITIGGAISTDDDDDDDGVHQPPDCAGGLGYYEYVGNGSCCCQAYCGPGAGPGKLPDRGYLDPDPDEDSCCLNDTSTTTQLREEAYWGCCNCPDGLWIIGWNSSRGSNMHINFASSNKQAQPNHMELESEQRMAQKLAHKSSKIKYEKLAREAYNKINHEKQANEPKRDERESGFKTEKLADEAFKMNHEKQDNEPKKRDNKPKSHALILADETGIDD